MTTLHSDTPAPRSTFHNSRVVKARYLDGCNECRQLILQDEEHLEYRTGPRAYVRVHLACAAKAHVRENRYDCMALRNYLKTEGESDAGANTIPG